jgi:tetratricopeptide (TPR) repeat protein
MVLLALILISVLIDGYRVLQERTDPFSSPARIAQSPYPIESIRSYKILKALSETAGPGFIFTEFMQVPSDNCLFVMTYGFNAAENSDLNFRTVQWAAVVSNSHYYSFLSKRFPEARWYWVHEGHPQGAEEVLGIIPITKENFQTLFSWVQAHHYFRQLSLAIDNISEEKTYKTAYELLSQPPASVAKDRFLESCYWERRAQFYYDYHFEVHYNDQVFALRQAIANGYPSAHLYYELGCLLARKGNLEQARSNFKSALRIEPQYLPVIEALEYLNQKEIIRTSSK